MSGAPIDPVALTQRLIRCRSVTPADDGAIGVLDETLRGIGFACEQLLGTTPGTPDILNLWARYGQGGKHFCFAGHTDVVPPGEIANWRADPFAAEIRDGFVIGRGAETTAPNRPVAVITPGKTSSCARAMRLVKR